VAFKFEKNKDMPRIVALKAKEGNKDMPSIVTSRSQFSKKRRRIYQALWL